MLRLGEVDPHDEAAFRRWYSVLEAAHPVDEPSLPPSTLESTRSDVPPPGDPYLRWHHLIALHGDSPVAAARVELTTDSPDLAFFMLVVRPDRRRQSVGSTLLSAVESYAAGAGRTVAVAETLQPTGAATIPGPAFAQRHGYSAGVVSVYRELVLPVTLPDAPVPGYRVVTWTERCPEELLDGRAALNEQIAVDDPAGGPHRQPEVWDGARIRMYEDRMISQGRRRLCAGAVHEETGELVAVTWFVRHPGERGHAHQMGTVVARAHRGRKLAMLIKVANLRQLASEWPDVQRVSSWNGGMNARMIAINEALGYRVAGEGVEWEKVLRS